MSEWAGRIRGYVEADFGPENVAHDLGHLDRVWRNCEMIAEEHGGDLDVLAAASYLHDLHRALERRSNAIIRPRETGGLVRHALQELSFPQERIGLAVACVQASGAHSFAAEPERVDGLEPAILKDADNLDALGAIGVARALMFGASLGEPLFLEEQEYAGSYVPGQTHSIVHHFHEKLLKLKDDMHTAVGQRLAVERHEFMLRFLGQLEAESGLAFAEHRQSELAPQHAR